MKNPGNTTVQQAGFTGKFTKQEEHGKVPAER